MPEDGSPRGRSQPEGREDPKLREIELLPDGIEVVHTPTQVVANLSELSGYRYTWTYRTTVRTLAGPVTVVEFGAFGMVPGVGWVFSNFTGEPFTNEDFGEWYLCPDGVLQPGEEYTDPENWTGSEFLHHSKALWYFIGELPDGTRVKGLAEIEELPILEQ